MKKHPTKKPDAAPPPAYTGLIGGIGELLETARHATARAVNSLMTATYWEVGRRIVKFEQGGKKRAGYGEELLSRLAADLTVRFGRGFSKPNLERMRLLYEMFPVARITSTASVDFLRIEPGAFSLADVAKAFPLPWSHCVLLLKSRSAEAFDFYHTEALRGGWSVRQLDRQINSLFYERAAFSKNRLIG